MNAETDGLPLFESGRDEAPLTVSQLTDRIKFVLEEDFRAVAVVGEIDSFKRHGSGHLYFELKDEEEGSGGRAKAKISAVMYRRHAPLLRFEPANGLKVLAEGEISVYPPQGKYQLVVRRMTPFGIGEQELRLRRLKEKLLKEGLFDEERKKPLPFLPKGVGVATSESGAAVRDIVSILRARNPKANVYLRPTLVQGASAPSDIAAAVRELDAHPGVEVIIVGRGGGSYEDLMAFNEEEVARAVAGARKPVVSAVGHRIDTTICDLVADRAAATPTHAAQMVMPDVRELEAGLASLSERLAAAAALRIGRARSRLDALGRALRAAGPLQRLRTWQQRVDELAVRLNLAAGRRLQATRDMLGARGEKLKALSPLAVLERGYAIVRKEGAVVRDAASLEKGDEVEVSLARGGFTAAVESVNPAGKAGEGKDG